MIRRWITPRAEPQDVDCIQLAVPQSPELYAVLRGLLLDMANPEFWEQLDGLTITPQLAADWSSVILDAFESRIPCN